MKKILAVVLMVTVGLAFAQTRITLGLLEPLNEHVERVLPQFLEHPLIIIFSAASRQVVEGLTAGAVKG